MAARVISADSHMMEPADLWTERLDRKFADRSPRVMKIEGKPGYSFVAPGVRPFPVAAGFGIGKSGQELKEHLQKGYEAARPSGWDPVERLKDQDVDGVAAEVIYTTLGMPLFGLDDAELQRACFRVYNDWVAEFRSYAPKRLHPIALISLEDIGEAVKELERAAKIGLKGAMIWGVPPNDRPYHDPSYEPFWAAAQANDVPLSLHVITEKNQGGDQPERAHSGPRLPGSVRILMGTMAPIHSIQRTLQSLIFGGVLERFPRLRHRVGRERQRLGRALHVSAGSLLREVRLDVRQGRPHHEAQRLHAPPALGHLPGRHDRPDDLEILRRGQLHVGL